MSLSVLTWRQLHHVFSGAELAELAEPGGGAAGSSSGDGSRGPNQQQQKKKRKLDDAVAPAAAACRPVAYRVVRRLS